MAAPKWPRDEARAKYVTEGKSCRELGKIYSISHSVIADLARKEDWEGQRLAYRNSVAQRSYEQIADAVSHEQAQIRTESVLVARGYIRQFAKDLAEGQIKTNAKDALEFIKVLASELAPAGEGNGPKVIEGSAIPIPGAGAGPEFLRRLVEVARERVAAPRGLGAGSVVEPSGTLPN